jgi:hypothetical protein
VLTAVLRIRDPVPFFDPWIRDEKPESYFREFLNHFYFLWLKILPGSRMEKILIRDPGWKNSDPGWKKIRIRDKHIPDPQHWLTLNEGREQLIASSEPSSRLESAQNETDMGENVDRPATDSGKAAKTALLSRIFSKPPSGKYLTALRSVGDSDPDPHVFGPPGSGSVRQRYGSGSFPLLIKVLSGLK